MQGYIRFLRRQGSSFAVIENEFGTAGADSATLRRDGVEVCEISGGCVCCVQKASFYELLKSLSGRYERILIEPSGLFNGDEYGDLLNTPALQERLVPGMALGIVDPGQIRRMADSDWDVFVSEMACVGRILLSKTQLYEAGIVRETRRFLADLLHERLAGGAEVWNALIDSTPWDSLEDSDYLSFQRAEPVSRKHRRYTADHTTLFQSATLTPARAYTREELESALRDLHAPVCGAVLRIKGRVRCVTGGCFWVNCTQEQTDIVHEPAKEDGTKEPSTALNIIGRGLRRREIARILSEGKA